MNYFYSGWDYEKYPKIELKDYRDVMFTNEIFEKVKDEFGNEILIYIERYE